MKNPFKAQLKSEGLPYRPILGEASAKTDQTDSGQNKLPPSDDRWAIRSETYKGIADAMAAQWGILQS